MWSIQMAAQNRVASAESGMPHNIFGDICCLAIYLELKHSTGYIANSASGAYYLMRCITPNVAISAYRRSVHPALASARESALAPGPV